jgi:preprotein translocase subunit YajC
MMILATPLMALIQAGAQKSAQGGGLLGFLPFILIFLVLYFLMIRPQAKKQKEQQKMIHELKQGDEVVTIGGIHGTIAGIREKDNALILKISDSTKVIIDRSAVSRTISA